MTPFLLGWTVMFFAAAAPGPSTLAIMATSLAHGRGAGLRFAVGVVCGSCVWGLVAGLGVAALLTSAGWALTLFKVVGAAYLLWMAWKSWRAASAAAPPQADAAAADDRPSDGAFWRRGLALHLSNPKAVMGWSATAAVGLPAGSGVLETAIFLGGCAVLALIINLGYALAFSTAPLIRAYGRARAALQRAFAAAFAAAGLGLLAWRP
ncbi:MAG: LysE family translocator [Pseudomonadota bacterium]